MSDHNLYSVNHAMHQHDLGRQLFYYSGSTKAELIDMGNGGWGFQYVYDNGLRGQVKFVRPTVSQSIEAYFSHKSWPRRSRYLQWEQKKLTVKQAIDDGLLKAVQYQGFQMIPSECRVNPSVEIRVPVGTKVVVTYY